MEAAEETERGFQRDAVILQIRFKCDVQTVDFLGNLLRMQGRHRQTGRSSDPSECGQGVLGTH